MSATGREWKVGEARRASHLGRLCLVFLVLIGFCLPAQASDLLDRVRNQEINQVFRLKVGRSKVLQTPFALTRISVADPDIADLILINEREIYINALAPGATNISMWGKSRFTSATVTVEADLTLLKEKLHQILPKERIGAEAAGDSIVLSGEVSGPVAQSTAMALALPYAGGKKDKVVNVMHVGGVQQVMLEVRVAEISRVVAERIGVNFNALAPGGNFGVNQINSLASVVRPDPRLHRRHRLLFHHLLRPDPLPGPHGHGGLDRGRDPVDRVHGPDEAAEPGPGAGGAQPGDHQRPAGLLPGGGRVPHPGAPERHRRGRHHHGGIQEIRGAAGIHPHGAERRQDRGEGAPHRERD